MKCLDLTLPAPSANLACDEALLDACDADPGAEILRFWEPRHYFVVLGYANRAESEVNLAACEEENVGVYRRCSGGGTVLQGPGCLNYSLVLNLTGDPALQTITSANRHIMERQRRALEGVLGRGVSVQGVTDLALGGLKFSGNAQRRKRQALLFHGVFLLRFDLAMMQKLSTDAFAGAGLPEKPSHDQFLTNLEVPAAPVKSALREVWSASESCARAPLLPQELEQKYTGEDWTLKF